VNKVHVAATELPQLLSHAWTQNWRGNRKKSLSDSARLLKAKFDYAVLVADRSVAGIWPITQRASRSAISLGPIYDKDSVMEVGFK